MTPRLDDFEGTDVDYIRYLETTVLSLRSRLRGEPSQTRHEHLSSVNLGQAQTTDNDDASSAWFLLQHSGKIWKPTSRPGGLEIEALSYSNMSLSRARKLED